MSAFIDNKVTASGKVLFAKAQLGKELKYTRIVLGDGYMPPGRLPEEMTDIVHAVAQVEIAKCKMNVDKSVTIGGSFTNQDIETDFYYRELALFAEDPDTHTEVLYSYGNCGNQAEYISAGDQTVIEKAIDITTSIENAENVTAFISLDVYARAVDLQEMSAHIERIERSTNDIPATGTKIHHKIIKYLDFWPFGDNPLMPEAEPVQAYVVGEDGIARVGAGMDDQGNVATLQIVQV